MKQFKLGMLLPPMDQETIQNEIDDLDLLATSEETQMELEGLLTPVKRFTFSPEINEKKEEAQENIRLLEEKIAQTKIKMANKMQELSWSNPVESLEKKKEICQEVKDEEDRYRQQIEEQKRLIHKITKKKKKQADEELAWDV